MAEVKLSMEEWDKVINSLNTLMEKLYETTKKCIDYKKQRDELIQDIAKLRKQLEDKKMNNTLDQLVEQVQQWSIDKDLHNGNSDRQALKFYEEAGEVASALSRGQMDALKDGIGDTVVTLIILAQQHDMTLQECLQYAYDEIKERKGKTINGTFIKEADLKE